MKRFQKTNVQILVSIFIISIPITPIIITSAASYVYDAQDVELNDNTFNETSHRSLQWWYIDAIFQNKYSIRIGITSIGSQKTPGIFILRLTLYYNGSLLEQKIRILPTRFFYLSADEPLIKLYNTEILRGYLDNKKQMTIHVFLNLQGVKTNLTLTGLTKGWKGFTGKGMWACPIPKGYVIGTITLHGKTIPVNGTGYQERGWNIQQLHESWFWGKFSINQTNIVFSQNMKNKQTEDLFIVMVNNGKSNYTSIQRDHILFYQTAQIINHGRLIPTRLSFQIDEDPMHIHVQIQVKSIHYTKFLFTEVWQLQTKITGTISMNNQTEIVNCEEIMEKFLR